MTPAIQVSGLGKRYRLRGSGRREEFWALRDVSFGVGPGEVVGVVGRNGAGKSTLLKVLARIVRPTSGRVELNGRVGSLLEVGTGFHPELTGRENIFLNGAILGMGRREVARRFDEIVAFAEVDRFLDTPVKRYSSGMYVRLAFAVAAHLESETLIVDEVLAVGDQSFRKKCLGRLREFGKSGRAVLLVSHDAAAVEALCSRCLLLDGGRLVAEGATGPILAKYQDLTAGPAGGQGDLRDHPGRELGSTPMMRAVELRDDSGAATSWVRMGSGVSVVAEFDPGGRAIRPVLGVAFRTATGAAVFGVNNRFIPGYEFAPCADRARVSCRIERLPLMPGPYQIDLYLGDEWGDLDVVRDAATLEVVAADVFGGGRLPPPSAGPVFCPASWSLRLGGTSDGERSGSEAEHEPEPEPCVHVL